MGRSGDTILKGVDPLQLTFSLEKEKVSKEKSIEMDGRGGGGVEFSFPCSSVGMHTCSTGHLFLPPGPTSPLEAEIQGVVHCLAAASFQSPGQSAVTRP